MQRDGDAGECLAGSEATLITGRDSDVLQRELV